MASPPSQPVQEEGGWQADLDKMSPSTRRKLRGIIQDVAAGEATIGLDDSGRPVIRYKAKSMGTEDKSQANLVASPKTDAQVQQNVEACLQLIERIKEERLPSGVVLDKTKITLKGGKYREGQEFEKLNKVIGKGNSAGDIVVIKDQGSDSEHAMKTVMISEFRKEEIRAWVDLSDSGIFPSLYLIQLRDNKVEMHMEVLKDAVSLQSVLDNMMGNIYKENPDLLRPFSLFLMHGQLKAAKTMLDKNWSHGDLHGGNVLLQIGDSGSSRPIEVKVIDFGRASPIKDASGTLTAPGVESDVLEIIRNFIALYTGVRFEDGYELMMEDRKEKLKQVTADWSQERREELFDIIAMAMAVIDMNSKHYHRPEHLIRKLEREMDEADYVKSLTKVATILLPSKHLQQPEEMECDVPDSAQPEDMDWEGPDIAVYGDSGQVPGQPCGVAKDRCSGAAESGSMSATHREDQGGTAPLWCAP